MNDDITMTQKAKQLWRTLREEGLVDFSTSGLIADIYWVSSHEKAYPITELSDMHLSNIIQKYWSKNETVPIQLLVERKRRKDAKEAEEK